MHCELIQRTTVWAVGLLIFAAVGTSVFADSAGVTHTRDVIYGRKHGVALTLDVLQPENPNGAGILWMVSGGWYSAHEHINPATMTELTSRGYTVFMVVHGSQPKYTIPEVLDDIHRAVRFVRHHAAEYSVHPERLGIAGGSAGGHLSLMLGTTGKPGKPDSKDLVDRESSRIRAVACFFPPTDFLNYGKPGENALGRGVLAGFRAPFDFHEYDSDQRTLVPITDAEQVLRIGREISPAYHVSADDAPTLIIHGDADKLVPIQQAEVVIEKLDEAGVPCKLVVKPGAAHGWPDLFHDMATFADWFDRHLEQESTRTP